MTLEQIIQEKEREIFLIYWWLRDFYDEDDYKCYKTAVSIVAGRFKLPDWLINNGMRSEYEVYRLAATTAASIQNPLQLQ